MYDFPYSDERQLAGSLKKLMALPPETKVFPGHGGSTTIGTEQSCNLLADKTSEGSENFETRFKIFEGPRPSTSVSNFKAAKFC